MYDTTLDPTISPDMVEAAHAVAGIDYDAVAAAMDAQLGQDDLTELGSGTVVPAKPVTALHHARNLSELSIYVGVGYCLKTVRDPEFRVTPLWPDAETAWNHGGIIGKTRHLETNPGNVPRGAIGYWTNGSHGHVAPCAGSGLYWSTDYKRSGYVDLVPGANLASWCGGRFVGWAEILNGYDVWPDPKAPKPTPHEPQDWDLRRRAQYLHNEAKREHAAHPQRAGQLEAWANRIDDRLKVL